MYLEENRIAIEVINAGIIVIASPLASYLGESRNRICVEVISAGIIIIVSSSGSSSGEVVIASSKGGQTEGDRARVVIKRNVSY